MLSTAASPDAARIPVALAVDDGDAHARRDVAELCHLWQVLAGFALEQLPIGRLGRLVDRQAAWQSRQSLEGKVAGHRVWHRELAALSGNAHLAAAVDQNLLLLAPYVGDGRLVECASVDPLLDALLQGDLPTAHERLREHVDSFRNAFVSSSRVDRARRPSSLDARRAATRRR